MKRKLLFLSFAVYLLAGPALPAPGQEIPQSPTPSATAASAAEPKGSPGKSKPAPATSDDLKSQANQQTREKATTDDSSNTLPNIMIEESKPGEKASRSRGRKQEVTGLPDNVRGPCKLLYNPMPPYPTAVRHAYMPVVGSGTFSVSFNSSGKVAEVKMIRSTGFDSLNDAAMSALRKWKNEPGQACTMVVPVTFHP